MLPYCLVHQLLTNKILAKSVQPSQRLANTNRQTDKNYKNSCFGMVDSNELLSYNYVPVYDYIPILRLHLSYCDMCIACIFITMHVVKAVIFILQTDNPILFISIQF